MTKGKCAVEGCESNKFRRAWCGKHYQRFMKYGDPEYRTQVYDTGSPEDRFWSKVDKTSSELGCWLWTASKDIKGYGALGHATGYPTPKAHRYSYILSFGDIPEGMQIDHKESSHGCPKHCVNPSHLRLATQKQNMENRGAHKGSRSGRRGVHWSGDGGRWVAKVYHNKVGYYLGSFPLYEIHIADFRARNKRLELHTFNEEDRK